MTKSMAVIVMACEIYLFYAKKKKKEDDVIGVLKTSFLTAHKRDTTCKDDVVDHDHSVRTMHTKSYLVRPKRRGHSLRLKGC